MFQRKIVAHDMNGPLEEEATGEVPSWDGAAWKELAGLETECSLTILPRHEDSQVLSLESRRQEETHDATSPTSPLGAEPVGEMPA